MELMVLLLELKELMVMVLLLEVMEIMVLLLEVMEILILLDLNNLVKLVPMQMVMHAHVTLVLDNCLPSKKRNSLLRRLGSSNVMQTRHR